MKLLYITSLSGKRINGFMRSAIYAAKNAGFEFVMACNTDMADKEGYKKDCEDYGIRIVHIDFERNPLNPKNKVAYKQLMNLMQFEKFDIVHCNTPIGGAIGRICAYKTGVRPVIYEAHGFHFYNGAPLKNWILYYPIEKWLSRFTDTLITITKDDYKLAQHMHAKHVAYVHGVGVNLDLFKRRASNDRNFALRQEIGIPKTANVLLSVGELNENKNHISILKALRQLNRPDVHYVICGEGELRKTLEEYIETHQLHSTVHLQGFQLNIQDYYRMTDLLIFPSFREGIPGAVLEAIASGVPVLASDIRGIRDIVTDAAYRFKPQSIKSISERIDWAFQQKHDMVVNSNLQTIEPYIIDSVVGELEQIYNMYRYR